METSRSVGRWIASVAIAFTAACGSSEPPVITSVDPATSTVGTTITIRGRGFDGRNDVGFELDQQQFPAGFHAGVTSADGEQIVFALPDGLGACPSTQLGESEACPLILLGLPDGYTKLFVVTEAGESNRVPIAIQAPHD
jgi:hypothetical protein